VIGRPRRVLSLCTFVALSGDWDLAIAGANSNVMRQAATAMRDLELVIGRLLCGIDEL
jgi:hypothetical protein